ncbi:TetR/AcrR family transcriptional regulator [Lichenifustis flavocetrariae]|uniref:TetR/AcrR family transcriptional regulator n=1 Tax=Lichenifustis flavocetrariae TaxID=2949735 RepID=A0AA41YVY0_9HYPH|nr:TetR/AcrR family transcriptional regulator [Lichenifustis flavocetrariae]MCW6509561.1 TetR/AcrR family transcriptional regulator [Lichenifustis flavocetrariae]
MTGRGDWFGDKEERRSYHHGRLKDALVEAARRLVAERGLAGFTLADAAKLVGVTAAAPYRHFSDRNALVEEMARRGFEQFGERLHKAWDLGQPNPRTALARMGEAYLDFARQEPGLYSAMFSNIQTLSAPAPGTAATKALDVLRTAAQVTIEASVPGPADGRELAFRLWAYAHGVATLTLAGHLDPAFEGGDPGHVLRQGSAALIDAAIKRAQAISR